MRIAPNSAGRPSSAQTSVTSRNSESPSIVPDADAQVHRLAKVCLQRAGHVPVVCEQRAVGGSGSSSASRIAALATPPPPQGLERRQRVKDVTDRRVGGAHA